jgi:lipopolysaccharide/colanic/teichoic acid biosynthesis glycosyltransferase
LAAIALAIKLDSRGPALFAQQRVGRFGRLFRMYKFRTMVCGAERRGPLLTIGRDSRITRLGHWLRKTKLDELPQLFNVLKGDMSLVGPRPEVPKYVALYDQEQRRVLDVRPGITDPASIAYIDESRLLAGSDDPESLYVARIMPAKLAYNLAYVEQSTVARDIATILKTLLRIIRPVKSLESPPP